MKRVHMVLAVAAILLCSCATTQDWLAAPADASVNADGTISYTDPGTGLVLVAPQAPSDPAFVHVPGVGMVPTLLPETPVETNADAVASTLGGVVGAVTSNPLLALAAGQGAALLLGLIKRKKS